MMFSATLRGVDARAVKVVAIRESGLPMLEIRGLGVAATRETRVRVQAAFQNSDRAIDGRLTVACDAGGSTIDGTALDLAVALAIAGVGANDSRNSSKKVGALGELSLAGDVRPVRGALAAVEELKKHVSVVLVAPENAAEAALVDGVRTLIVRRLSDALRFLAGDEAGLELAGRSKREAPGPALDMRDIKGQAPVRRALEIAAAGNHNLLLVGGPGSGKTMFARRLPGLLPPMTDAEALEVTRVHSAAGLNIGGGLITTRPFRAPHHSTTPPGLVGGGAALPRPGEVSLAHNGVLFLDELPEFSRATLEFLREPLEAGEVVLTRASGTLRFPSRCMLIASMAPCPCGRGGTPGCRCAPADRVRYRGRVPDALIENFDIRVFVPAVDLTALDSAPPGEASAIIAERVATPRLHPPSDVPLGTSAAAQRRAMRVARTIAALAGETEIRAAHVTEALALAGSALAEAVADLRWT